MGLLSNNHRTYAARTFLISGDCKRETGTEHKRNILQPSLDGVNKQKPLTQTRIVSVASDGESRRGAAMAQLTFKKELSPDSDIYNILRPLPFMDLHVGDDDLTADKDYKHVFKRLRNLLLRDSGIVVGGVTINSSIIRKHLLEEKVKAEHVNSILNPNDKQDVKLAFDLLKAIWSLPQATDNLNPAFVRAREALWIFGRLLYHTLFPYLCVDLTLSEQLEHMSAAAHLAVHLYRTDGPACLPNILFIDMMLMLKNAYFCVAKTKVDNPKGSFWIILLGTDRLEELFGNLRTMIGNDANLDLLQTSWRLSGTAEVANILAKYPHWDRPPRRLNIPPITRDCTPLPGATDHLKPGSWVGDVTVEKVTLQTCWVRGRRLIEQSIPSSAPTFGLMETEAETSDTRISILAPHGKLLVQHVPHPEDVRENEDLNNESRTGSTDTPSNDHLAEDNADARVAVEDSIAEEYEEGPLDDLSTKVAHTVEIDGKLVRKSRALASFGKYRTYASSTDRLKRVQDTPRFADTSASSLGHHATALDQDDTSGESTVVHDPIASILWSDDRPWLCVGEVLGIKVDGANADELETDMLGEDNVRVVFQLTGLRPATVSDDSTEKHDWRTCSVPNARFTVPGRLIEAINPILASPLSLESPQMFWLLDSEFLVALSAAFLARLDIADVKSAPKISLPFHFPYKEATGACRWYFIVRS